MDEHELPDEDAELKRLVDTAPAGTASTDALREIVARRDRWRVRALAITLAVAVVGLPIAGYAIGQARSSGTVIRAANAPQAAPQPSGASGAASSAIGSGGFAEPGVSPKQLFVRDTADGVRIRGYLTPLATVVPKCAEPAPAPAQPAPMPAPAGPAPAQFAPAQPPPGAPTPPPSAVPPATAEPVPCPVPPNPACVPSGILDAEVSDDQVAGQVTMPAFPASGQALRVIGAQITGSGEPTPIGSVLIRTGSGVASVELRFQNGPTDRMSPVDGYAILAGQVHGLPVDSAPIPLPAVPERSNGPAPAVTAIGYGFPKATVRAFDGSGKQVASIDLPSVIAPILPDVCGIGGSATGSGTATAGTATAGTATAGTATVSGTASSNG